MRDKTSDVLVVTKGHPFEKMAFFEMLDALPGVTWTHVEHPAACALLDPIAAEPFGAVLFYDLPGIYFVEKQAGFELEIAAPPDRLRASMERLLHAGKPLIFLHHALSGWPSWPRYAEIIGARYNLVSRGPGEPDDGFRMDTVHHVECAADHAITRGLEGGFDIEDEIYLYNVDENGKTALLRSKYKFEAENFYSTEAFLASSSMTSVAGGWRHPKGSDLVAWLKMERNSPVIYIQCGHGPAAYRNPSYRRLILNAINWACSEQAGEWVASNRHGASDG